MNKRVDVIQALKGVTESVNKLRDAVLLSHGPDSLSAAHSIALGMLTDREYRIYLASKELLHNPIEQASIIAQQIDVIKDILLPALLETVEANEELEHRIDLFTGEHAHHYTKRIELWLEDAKNNTLEFAKVLIEHSEREGKLKWTS